MCARARQDRTGGEKVVNTPGCASFEIRVPSPQNLLFGRINLEPSPATASKHRSPHSVRDRVRVRVRVRVGWSASVATAKKKHLSGTVLIVYTWYQVLWFSSTSSSYECFIVGMFQTRAPRCAYTTTLPGIISSCLLYTSPSPRDS